MRYIGFSRQFSESHRVFVATEVNRGVNTILDGEVFPLRLWAEFEGNHLTNAEFKPSWTLYLNFRRFQALDYN